MNMKWYLSIIAWIADAIKRKAELGDDNSVDSRLSRLEEKLERIDKSNIPVALFASGLPIYLIGFAGSLNNAIQALNIKLDYLIYLIVGALLVNWAMVQLKEKRRNIYISMGLTFGSLIAVSVFNLIRLP